MSRTLCCDAKVECPSCEGGQEAESFAEMNALRTSLAASQERVRVLEREIGITVEQWEEEIKAGRPGIVYGSRMGQLKAALKGE